MTQPSKAPFGSWDSPITPEMVARGGMSPRGTLGTLNVSDGQPYWRALLTAEGGRSVVRTRPAGQDVRTLTPVDFNVRTTVHEYGGGSFFVHHATVFFSNYEDQRLYRQDPGEDPRPITGEPVTPGALRYADGCLTPDGRWIFVVRERHEPDGQVFNEIMRLPADGHGSADIVASGRDFYAAPRVDHAGRRLVWLCWDHPQMPWDGTELWQGELDEAGVLSSPRKLAGGSDESILQPQWSPEDELYFISDRTGWWNLYRSGPDGPVALAPMEAEFGGPSWTFANTYYDFLSKARLGVIYTIKGIEHFGVLDLESGAVGDFGLPYTSATPSCMRSDGDHRLWFIASGPKQGQSIVQYDVDTGDAEFVQPPIPITFDPAYISEPEPIEFPTGDGQTAHAFYYPPTNPRFQPPAGEKPPLLVHSHGGPTSAFPAQYHLEIQFFTSRGFAVAEVNYRGSTGYGRAYRNLLRGQWGLADTEDCVKAARYLAEQGLVDPHRKGIRGGSAGGYATLCALTDYDDFEVGASYYGVADAEALETDTHKFESHYSDLLIAPYPERRDVYRERSPIDHTDSLSAPLILFQGLEDKIVPPDQAERMAEALDRKGIPYAYLAFAGEQHGFRRQETIVRCLQAEMTFYGTVFGFTPAGDLPPLDIKNLP